VFFPETGRGKANTANLLEAACIKDTRAHEKVSSQRAGRRISRRFATSAASKKTFGRLLHAPCQIPRGNLQLPNFFSIGANDGWAMYVSPWVYLIFGAVCQREKVRRQLKRPGCPAVHCFEICVMFNSGICPSRNWE